MTHKWSKSWNMLRQLNNRHSLPWICVSDFNELLRSSRKLGGSSRSQSQMQQFRNVVDECGFHDLRFMGSQYTWKKHFADGHSIWERLYRALANNDWVMKFPGTKVHILSSDTSDHSPLWVILDYLEQPCMVKPFKFEEMWLTNLGCANIIEAAWSPRSIEDPSVGVMRKIERRSKELSRWNQVHFGNVRKELQKKIKLLKEAEDQAMQTRVNFRVCALK